MVSVDIYLNETTRHADVILPVAVAAREEPLRRGVLRPVAAPDRQLVARGVHHGPAERERGPRPARARRCAAKARTATPTVIDEELLDGRPQPCGREPRQRTCTGAMPRELRPIGPRGRLRKIASSMPCVRTGPVRRRLRRRAVTACHCSAAPGEPARHRSSARSSRACPSVLEHRVRQGRARATRDRRRGPARCSTSRRPPGRPHAHRPPRPALEQQLDAQRQRADEGQGALHAADPSRRRRRAWPRDG